MKPLVGSDVRRVATRLPPGRCRTKRVSAPDPQLADQSIFLKLEKQGAESVLGRVRHHPSPPLGHYLRSERRSLSVEETCLRRYPSARSCPALLKPDPFADDQRSGQSGRLDVQRRGIQRAAHTDVLHPEARPSIIDNLENGRCR